MAYGEENQYEIPNYMYGPDTTQPSYFDTMGSYYEPLVLPMSESYTATGIPSQREQGYGGGGVAGQSGYKQPTQPDSMSYARNYATPDYGSARSNVNRVSPIATPVIPNRTMGQFKALMSQIESPVIESSPIYTAPKWDESRVSKYASKFASPYISEMRKAIRDAIVRTSSTTSPIQRRYQLGGALEKSGEGYGKIMSQANVFGASQYQNEYNRLADESRINYTSGIEDVRTRNVANQQRYMAFYNTALADFMSGKLT